MRDGYTLKWNRKMFYEKKIDRKTFLINEKYIKLDHELEKTTEKLTEHYRNLIKEDFDNAKNKEDLRLIKEKLRLMPESSSKVFVFRDILLKESEFEQLGE